MHPRRLEARILKSVNLANREFGLLKEGDRVLVALSGGKDSYGLMWALKRLRAAAPYRFDLVAFHLDQGQPGHDTSPIDGYMRSLEVPYEIEYQDTYTRVVEKTEEGKVYCSLCSRFRRAILYRAALRHGCNKVALGHHRDDLVETLLLNLFFSGQLKSMPPRLLADNGHLELIRPLAYVAESELLELSDHHGFPVVPCRLCGSQDGQRKAVKQLLAELTARYPRLPTHMLAALGNVRRTHLLDKSINPLYNGESVPLADITEDAEAANGCGDSGNGEALVQLGSALAGPSS